MVIRTRWFIPALPNCTLKYLVQLCNEEKLFLNQPAVSQLQVPAWEELAVHKIWEDANRNPHLRGYLPDEWYGEHPKRDRKFFYSTLATVCPQFVDRLVLNCEEQRRDRRNKPVVVRSLKKIHPKMLQMLLARDFQSSK